MATVPIEVRETVMDMDMATARLTTLVLTVEPAMEKPGAATVPVLVELVNTIHKTVPGTTRVPNTKTVPAMALVMQRVLATVVQLMVRALGLDLAPSGMALMVAMGKVVINTPQAMADDRKTMAPTVQVMVVAMSPVLVTVMATKPALALATQNMLPTMVITRKLPNHRFCFVINLVKLFIIYMILFHLADNMAWF